jgi:membrane-associated phospholipid phosphatase
LDVPKNLRAGCETDKMQSTAAQLISHAFNAPVMAALAFLWMLLPEKGQRLVAHEVISLTFATLIPLLLLFYLQRAGRIPDIYASQRESRATPFLGAISSYLAGTTALLATAAPKIVTALMLCYLGNSLIMMLITRVWKISVHASGITGPATVLIYSVGVAALPVLLLVIPVGWARIMLKAHTPAQVLAGGLLTIATTLLQLELYLAIL